MTVTGFVPPPYPYDRVDRFKPLADEFEGGLVDFSIGTPFDAPPKAVIARLGDSGLERGYPPSIGSAELREAVRRWMARRFDLEIPPTQIGACIGTKEFVGTLPQWLRLRRPDRDTVLYPAISYPTYEMGATLAGCRAVPVAMSPTGGVELDSIDPADAARALALWVNSPGNPNGVLDDLGAAATWGRANGVPVFSDECYPRPGNPADLASSNPASASHPGSSLTGHSSRATRAGRWASCSPTSAPPLSARGCRRPRRPRTSFAPSSTCCRPTSLTASSIRFASSTTSPAARMLRSTTSHCSTWCHGRSNRLARRPRSRSSAWPTAPGPRSRAPRSRAP